MTCESNLRIKSLYTVKELVETNGGPLPISESFVYKAIQRGEISSVRIGKRILVPLGEVERLLACKLA